MIYHRKRLILRRLNRLMRMKRLQQIQSTIKEHMEPSTEDDEQQQYGTPIVDIPFELIQIMTATERKKIRNKYPNLPSYLFMNEQEKKSYFLSKNQQYQSKLKTQKERMSKTKKIVKFSKKFEYKAFGMNQKVGTINQTAALPDSYRPEHYS